MEIPLWLLIIMQFVLIALNAVFACAEIAVIEFKGAKLDKLADEGNKRAKRLKKLSDNPAKFLATIQVAITLSGFLASAFAADGFSTYIVDWLGSKGLKIASDAVIEAVSILLITCVLSYITLIFGELVPKRVAMTNTEKTALGLSGPVSFIAVVFKPVVWLLTVSTNLVLKILHINPNADESDVSEEDIRMMADAGSEKGVIDEEENEMIQNVFEFDDITVGEIATHRTEMTVLWLEDSDEEWLSTVKRSIHSYYPICGDSMDRVTGILDAEKYLRLDDRSRKNVLKEASFRPRFVPQVMKADVLFREMKRENINIAVVVDEYGGTYGIVTLNDLIEQIVGDLNESEDEGDIRRSGNGFLISGLADRESLDELFDLETDSDSATLGGWVMEKLEKIPEPGDTFEESGVLLKVTKANDKRVLEVYAEKLPEPADEGEAEEQK